ncbi:hypothetical protein SISSUDRAFT_186263 [Sistotremastrum suecicum HHB10207 ss-3]|uniref:Uncharacterized protein n=1 Tax=Sistotremastrum suecicum HHB10207 ss-3 TaxID=1314776 RepID=A0A166AG68_9AGAM|nr:hypothetical protein SISSUDRAFT_186263 [Sistotremastrum suecicum HHB10207 ss-3]
MVLPLSERGQTRRLPSPVAFHALLLLTIGKASHFLRNNLSPSQRFSSHTYQPDNSGAYGEIAVLVVSSTSILFNGLHLTFSGRSHDPLRSNGIPSKRAFRSVFIAKFW